MIRIPKSKKKEKHEFNLQSISTENHYFFLLSLKGKILKTHLERIEIIITLEQKAANRDR